MDEGFSVEQEGEGAAGSNRTAGRDSMFLMAAVRNARTGHESSVRVRNLSAGGLMGDIAGQYAAGDAVEIDLRGVGTVVGQVAWCRGERIGIAFAGPIDPKAARKPVTVKPARPKPPIGPGRRPV